MPDVPTRLQLAQYRSAIKHFVEFSDEQWELFGAHLYVRKLNKKELFVTEEKICSELGFISEGSFRMFLMRDGIERTNYFSFANELVTSYGSFLKQTPGGVNIEAMEPSVLLCISFKSFTALNLDPRTVAAVDAFRRNVAEYLICCYEERVLSFVARSPEERYMQLLNEQPAFLQKVPQHHLANYLGITAVSLSRIRKRLFSAGTKKKIAS